MTDESEKQRWDAYFIGPHSNVLRNKLGLRNYEKLRIAEYKLRALRQLEIERGDVEIPRTFDAAHLRALHRHLLQDVYEWAGEFRDLPVVKDKKGFVAHQELETWLDDVGRRVRGLVWPTMARREFVENISAVYADVNVAHPFREGNGVACKLYISQLSELSPYEIRYDRVSKERWDQAAGATLPPGRIATAANPWPMYAVFERISFEREAPPGLAEAARLHASAYPQQQVGSQPTAARGLGEQPERNRPRGEQNHNGHSLA
ncbi:Fic family protein [Kribbella sp. NBC_00709]|uniref:Fic/DOC family protein n=1 Tax=Kribbella sp. NBC_00709 TaxID=2975972 RepID=UPI002E2DFA86|nr:Fic family protein [Kribbella sp. NBC_00709]